MTTLTGGAKLQAKLKELADKIGSNSVSVGFLEDATYPDGTNVAQVAFWLNYGTKTAPPRPFFTNMIRDKSEGWGNTLAKLCKAEDFDVHKVMGLMGEGIKGQLQQAIIDLDAPPLSKVTLMLRKMLIDNPNLEITGTVVGEAARRVSAGESSEGASTKVGIYTSHMLNSVDYVVKE